MLDNSRSEKTTEPKENQAVINRPAPPTAHDGLGGAPAINSPKLPAGDTTIDRAHSLIQAGIHTQDPFLYHTLIKIPPD